MFLHGLEQRRLRAWRRAIDLVGEHDVREHRPAHEPEAAMSGLRVFLEQFRAGDVARHEVRRELDAPELQRHRLRDRANHERLRETGHTHEQRVPTGDERHEDLIEHFTLPDDAARHLGAQTRRRGQECVAVLGYGGARRGVQRTGRRWR